MVKIKSKHRLVETTTLFNYIEQLVIRLQGHGQHRTAETYRSTLNSLRRFRQDQDLSLNEIDAPFLMDYQYYLKNSGLLPNTVSFYLKRLRAIYNKAVEDKLTTDQHPFRKVSTASEKTAKRAIPLKYIKKLKELDLSDSPSKRYARDIFLFSFYTRGMPFVDMAHLKKANLQNGMLTYRRKKTGQVLSLHWESCMKKIAKEYASPPSSPYLLSIIQDPEGDIRKQCHNALTLIDRHLKEIGRSIGLSAPLTLYVSRHSWASIARDEGVPVSVISEAMGHESEKTTRIYLASLKTEVVDEANRMILRKLR